MIGEDRLIHFSGVALGEACTIVLRGASTHILDEADRSLHDALCVLQVRGRNFCVQLCVFCACCGCVVVGCVVSMPVLLSLLQLLPLLSLFPCCWQSCTYLLALLCALAL